jgi:hypothetical protein
MRLFTLLDYHHIVLAVFLGCVAALSIYLAFRHHSRPVPGILIFVYLGVAVWAVFYVIFVAILGGPV